MNDTKKQPTRDDRLIRDTRRLPNVVRLIDTRDVAETDRNRLVNPDELYRLRLDTGLDLIMIDGRSSPPVVKLLDYGKFLYEEKKAQKEVARKQREITRGVKEFYFGINIGQHDYDTKVRHVREALEDNHDVRIAVKNNRDTRMALPRHTSLDQYARTAVDFVLKRVLAELGSEIRDSQLTITPQLVHASLKRA